MDPLSTSELTSDDIIRAHTAASNPSAPEIVDDGDDSDDDDEVTAAKRKRDNSNDFIYSSHGDPHANMIHNGQPSMGQYST